ncbi:hypothetical protein H5410_057420 [Solanum commersonii]|uniref:Uncharacterized protein n=1 Tax=Solanum commersonii TaxID=4109 RepID=A0A9J5WQT0_SOLCO|nr:hypothetical protein H5410_057420 [Solanum commersonii]
MFNQIKVEETTHTNGGYEINAIAVAASSSSDCSLDPPVSTSLPTHFPVPIADPASTSSSQPPNTLINPSPRRSTRTTKGILPAHLKDYFCNTIFLSDVSTSCFSAPIQTHILSSTDLSPSNQFLLHSIAQITEPTNYYQASIQPGWKQAIDAEIALQSNHTWDVVSLPHENTKRRGTNPAVDNNKGKRKHLDHPRYPRSAQRYSCSEPILDPSMKHRTHFKLEHLLKLLGIDPVSLLLATVKFSSFPTLQSRSGKWPENSLGDNTRELVHAKINMFKKQEKLKWKIMECTNDTSISNLQLVCPTVKAYNSIPIPACLGT